MKLLRNLIMRFVHTLLIIVTQAYAEESGQDKPYRPPPLQRHFLVSDIQLTQDISLPISPISIIILVVSIIILKNTFAPSKSSTVTASHILLPEDKAHPEKAKETLLRYKKEIQDNAEKFAIYAQKNSTCPSGKQGGKLGSFKPNQMVPPFDKAVFDPRNEVGKVLEPVQTQFGWHLILITDRELVTE